MASWSNCSGGAPLSGTAACALSTANKNAAAGDTVYLRGGTYVVTGATTAGVYPINPTNSGTSPSSMITYSAYTADGTTYETVSFAGDSSLAGANSCGIQISGKSYIKVTHLNFTNLHEYLAIRNASDHNEISYCKFENERDPWADIIYDSNTGGTGGATNGNGDSPDYYHSTSTLYDKNVNLPALYPYAVRLYNVTDKSSSYYCNTWTTHTLDCHAGGQSDLTGGTNNYWSNGDRYQLTHDFSQPSSYINNSSTHNWIHHCVFNKVGGGYTGAGRNNLTNTMGEDGGATLIIGSGSSTTDHSDNNTLEYNEMYGGGHQVFSHYSGIHEVIRHNYLHNEGWFSDAKYSNICSSGDNGVCSIGRAIYTYHTNPSYGGRTLYENNAIGFGSQYGGPHPLNSGASGSGAEIGSCSNIWRYNDHFANAMYGLGFSTATGHTANNRVYNNTFFHNGYNESSYGVASTTENIEETTGGFTTPDRRTGMAISDDSTVAGNVIINNLFYKNWAERNLTGLSYGSYYSTYFPAIRISSSDTAKRNTIANNYTGGSQNPPYTSSSAYPAETDPLFTNEHYPTAYNTVAGSLDATYPAWVNYTLVHPDLTLQAGSPAIDKGTYLATASGSGSSSTTLVVADAAFFQDGTWGSDLAIAAGVMHADLIAIGTVGKVVQIQSIDYSTNTITLAAPMSWANGAPIWLYKKSDGAQVLYGSAPDMGAHEYHYSCKNGDNCTTPNKPSPFTVQRVK
jgi:hypothetical protein